MTFGASQFVENPEQKIRFKYMEIFSWMLGEFASLKSKHDIGVVDALTENSNSVRECDGIFKRCVQKKYTSAKIPSRHQLGEFSLWRSMIEMLVVLAIVGVLSVGGIVGYSKAMMKFKTNKTIEQVNQIVTGMITAFANHYQITKLNSHNNVELFKALNIIDNSMLNDNGILTHPFGGEFSLAYYRNRVSIELYYLPREACIALATYDWGFNYRIGVNAKGILSASAADCLSNSYTTDARNYWALGCRKDGGIPLTHDKAAI